MRRTVLTYGLVAGAILSLFLALTTAFWDRIGFEHGMTVGYTSMVIAFLMVYFGVRSYRDDVGGGTISFWRALGVGMLIVVVATVCYVITWEFINFYMMPDFMTQYAAYTLEQSRASGATPDQLAVQARDMARYVEMYRNPLYVAAFTFLEPLPPGLILSVLSAAILRRGAGVRTADVPVRSASPAL